MQLGQFLKSMRDRHLYKAAALYTAGAWLLLQVADVVVESFDWPAWLMQGLIVLVVAGLPLTLLAVWFFADPDTARTPEESSGQRAAREAGDRPSLIVLPFDAFSDDPADRWAADALTEDITTLIARFPDYSVVARNTAFAYKGRHADVRTLGAELGVRYVLEGSLRRQPGGLRVTAQLIEAATGAHLWAEHFDRSQAQLDELHDEICRAVALRLGNELTRAEMNLSLRKPPSEWGAWELYQQAKGVLQFKGWSNQSFAEVAGLLRRAIEVDPDYAPAHGHLALILALGYWARFFSDREATYEEAMAAANRAISLAPASSEVLGFAGCALSDLGHHDRGIPIIERAIELNPSNSQAIAALGAAQVVSGRVAEGIRDLRHAVTISPADPGLAPWSSILSIAECYMGNPQEALKWADRARKADPSYFAAYLALAMAHTALGQEEAAQRDLVQACELHPGLSHEAAAALLGENAWEALLKAGVRLPEPG